MEATGWISFDDRSPTEEEQDSDRVLGYFVIYDHKGRAASDFFGKIFWDDAAKSWAVESYENALALVSPGQFNYELVKPTHWCLVDKLPFKDKGES
jgi:hypothetical protein